MKRTKFTTAIAMGTLVVTLSSNLSFAAPTVFTDIGGHWAKGHIEDIYNRKITTGYPDATFKPQGNITKLESVVMISKLMGYSNNNEAYYISLYKPKLDANNITEDWARGPVAYALFNDILLEEDLKGLVSTSQQTYAKRYEVATYIGRVLQNGAGKQIRSIYSIPYIDEMNIPQGAKRYIDLLLENDILDESSNNRRFLPNNLITRAEVSKLISLSAQILDEASTDGSTIPPNNTTPDRVIGVKTINGDIDNVILGTKNIISIASGNTKQIYDIDSNVDITINGKVATVDKLERGQEITAKIEDDIIVNITAISTKEVFEGYFHYYLGGSKPMVFFKDSKGTVKSFEFTNNSDVYLMDRAANIEDLTEGDVVNVIYVKDEVIEIEAETKEKILEGVVKSVDINRREMYLEVLMEDDTWETFTITSDATLRRDRRSISFEDIKVGDEVEITQEYGNVIYVNAFSVQKTVEGYIKSISFGENTEITIENYDGDTELFLLTPKTIIELEGERKGVYDLRVGYEVELDIENNEVLSVEAYRKMQGAFYQGKVAYIDYRRETIEMQISGREEIEIDINDETIFLDENADKILFRDINEGDEIDVVAEDNGYYIVAKRVLVVIRR